MKRVIAALVFMAAAGPATQPAAIDYRFEEVRRSVVIESRQHQKSARRGDLARSGDKVRTGWFSYALIASDLYRARFEIFASSEVELTAGTPGVLLSINRGKLHAIFDKITGNEPRVVQTPGALLAVRGTQYTVEVSASGETTLDVTEGVVEVRSPLRHEPLMVRAGESASFSRQQPPESHPMQPRGQGNGDNRPRDGSSDPHGHGAPPSGLPGSGPHGAPSPSTPPPPPPTTTRHP